MTAEVYAGNLDWVLDTADAASYSTGLASTVTPIVGAVLVCPVLTLQASGASPPTVASVSGWGLTWESVYGPDAYDSVGTTFTLEIYAALAGDSPAAGNISYTLSGTSTSGFAIVDYFVNLDTSGGTAESCFVQTSTVAQGTNTSGSQTLGALADSRNISYGFSTHVANEDSVQGGAFTLLNTQHNTSPSKGGATEWGVNQTTVDWSWTTSTDYAIWAAELKASPVSYGVWFVP